MKIPALRYRWLLLLGGILSIGLILACRYSQEKKAQAPPAPSTRVPWTTSRITGSPEPPHPYKIVRSFPKLTFRFPLLLTMAPGLNRFFVGEQKGKIWSFPNDQDCAKADLFLDISKDLSSWDKTKVEGLDALYGLAFHPQFAKNRYCYICYVLNGKNSGQLPDGSRVSRFRVADTDPPRCDPKSEKVIVTFLGGGHNGGDLHFGNDGFLYISTGDGANPNPPDNHNTGQDISDLLSSILRIDVDHESANKPYAIPPDNPFIKTAGARPEVWAYGFRNPWRMSFDRPTGDLWVGDVGWELWEMIYRVKRGGNYGWSIMEGPQPVRPEGQRGPTPILPPQLAFPHAEAASITGGFVYRGRRLKELVGAYICGDWLTRKLWGTRFDGDKIVWHKELAQGTQRIVAFGLDHDQELYFVNHDKAGTLHQIVPNEQAKDYRPSFPRLLGETGLFSSVARHEIARGVVPFAINGEAWSDHAQAERFLALPAATVAKLYDRPIAIPRDSFPLQIFFPKDGVLAKTLFMEMEAGNAASRRRLETQILHYDGTTWNGYTYAWNKDQTDAALVPAGGAEQTFVVKDAKAPGGKRRQTWQFASRAQCLTCHNPWARYALAFNPLQLSGAHGNGADDQLSMLKNLGLVTLFHYDVVNDKAAPMDRWPSVRLTNPLDAGQEISARARSYLHVNCAPCHQIGAGGTANIDLRFTKSLEQTKTVGVTPNQGSFDIKNAALIEPGDPYSSVLYCRMSKTGPGHMPHIGSEIIDERGLRLVHDWIRQMPGRQVDWTLIDKLAASAGQAKDHAAESAALVNQLLSSTRSALMLAHALDENRFPESLRLSVLAASQKLPGSQARDLFERFLPDDQRVRRLGTMIRADRLLALKGDVARGRELFFKSAGIQCVNCHRIAGTGSTLGPDLSEIGKKYTRAQILESILEPSKFIDPKYVSYVAETKDGQIVTGLLASRNEKEVVMRTAQDKEVRLPAQAVVALQSQQLSLMPEMLLRDLTAEQAIDLVDFLASLK